MAFRLPVFNLECNAWTTDTPPDEGDPEVTGLECQIYVPSRGAIDVKPGVPSTFAFAMYLRYPIATDPARFYYAECPAGSGVYYKIRFTTVNHQGFANQYWSAVVEYCCGDGTPVYFPGAECGPSPPSGSFSAPDMGVIIHPDGEGFMGDG